VGLTHRDWVWRNDGYSGDRFNALLYVAERCNEQNLVWRGREDIAYYTNQSVRSVEKSLAVFVKDGVLSVEQIGRGRGNTTVYRFNPPKDWKAPARRKAALSHVELKGEDISPFSSAGKGELESIKGELDDTEKANLTTEKANLATSHIRNNRHEPKKETDMEPTSLSETEEEATQQALFHLFGWRTLVKSSLHVEQVKMTAQQLFGMRECYGAEYAPLPERIARFPDFAREMEFKKFGPNAVVNYWKRFVDWDKERQRNGTSKHHRNANAADRNRKAAADTERAIREAFASGGDSAGTDPADEAEGWSGVA